MNDLEYIKRFSKITIREVCKKANVDQSNLWSGKASKEKIKQVREIIQNEVSKLNEEKE